MSLRLLLARCLLPLVRGGAVLRDLFDATAQAFAVQPPQLPPRLRRRDLVRAYASFTREQAEKTLAEPWRVDAVRARLQESARALGARARKQMGVRTRGQAMSAARLIYRLLGIDLRGAVDGGIVVGDCFFASHYTPEVCRLISALDAGLLDGLAGGGRLQFSQRITEGAAECRARFDFATGAK